MLSVSAPPFFPSSSSSSSAPLLGSPPLLPAPPHHHQQQQLHPPPHVRLPPPPRPVNLKVFNLFNLGIRVVFVDSPHEVEAVCRVLMGQQRLVVDCEGIDLSRTGTISLIQIASIDGVVYIFDITTLKSKAFEESFMSLKKVLEAPHIIKLLFDARSDCDALLYQYGVMLSPLVDLQIAHMSAFAPSNRFVTGLKTVLEKQSPWLTQLERDHIAQIKEYGCSLFAPERGGAYEVWDKRPLSPFLIEYAAADVALLFRVFDHALMHMKPGVGTVYELMQSSKKRVEACLADPSPKKGRERCVRDFEPVC